MRFSIVNMVIYRGYVRYSLIKTFFFLVLSFSRVVEEGPDETQQIRSYPVNLDLTSITRLYNYSIQFLIGLCTHAIIKSVIDFYYGTTSEMLVLWYPAINTIDL